MKIIFLSTTGPIEKRLMHPKIDYVGIKTGFNRAEIIQELFKSRLHKYQITLEQSIVLQVP